MGTREDIARAVSEGAEAGRRGDPPTVCPYPRTSLLSGAWVRGYARARPLTTTEDDAE
ncbi:MULTISPECIES: Rmf/CrpP fold protein [unclassified Streptomyces]|uniref:Rmf/CrpP fold protein n=1 Tax=Streptomyces sp. NPDC055082 TaxID=3365718 RepID=UPI0037CD3309